MGTDFAYICVHPADAPPPSSNSSAGDSATNARASFSVRARYCLRSNRGLSERLRGQLAADNVRVRVQKRR
jgi:hypothetical protein